MSIELKPCPFPGAEPGMRMEMAGLEFVSFDHGPECYFATLKIVGKSISDPFFAAWNTRTEMTCRDESGGDPCAFVCSHCGSVRNHPEDEPIAYCPNCGAKVVDE